MTDSYIFFFLIFRKLLVIIPILVDYLFLIYINFCLHLLFTSFQVNLYLLMLLSLLLYLKSICYNELRHFKSFSASLPYAPGI